MFMSVLAVIPARYGSSRFPGKPLALLQGRPVIQHVYERVAQARGVDEVVVATEDERIVQAVERFGGVAMLTSPAARSGTERVAEVAQSRSQQVVINVQGDEPLVQPEMVQQVAEFLERHRAVPMASLMTRLVREDEMANPNVVKVVVDRDGYALYFSRAPIPYVRPEFGARDPGPGTRDEESRGGFLRPPAPGPRPQPMYKHIGLYGYQRRFLLQFRHLEPTPLEGLEQLEQLRALEHGFRIKLLETSHETVGVDTPEDLKKVEAILQGPGTRDQGPGNSGLFSPAPGSMPPAPLR